MCTSALPSRDLATGLPSLPGRRPPVAHALGGLNDEDRSHRRCWLWPQRMLPQGAGTILLTGASASVKGYPQSAVFAMGKFALRGLAQWMARELAPKGIHVAHFVIDGIVRNAEKGRVEGGNAAPDSFLDPEAIAQSYLHMVQHRERRRAKTPPT